MNRREIISPANHLASMPRYLWLLVILVLGFTCRPGSAADTEYKAERKQYLQAQKALKAGNLPRFYRLAEGLRDYPLYPYLRYKKLRRHLSNASDHAVREFLANYKDTPLAPRLRRAWLHTLAKQKKWRSFLEFYQEPQSVELQCNRLQAYLALNTTKDITADAHKLWLVGHSQPDACDPAFNYLYQHRLITRDQRWSRAKLAMDERKLKLAGYLVRKLPRQDRDLFSLWKQVHRRPGGMLQHPDLQKDTGKVRDIVLHGIRQQARSNIEKAHINWSKAKRKYTFSAADIKELEHYLAMRSAYVRHPRAYEWFNQLPKKTHTEKSRAWQIRVALRDQDWVAALHSIESLPGNEQQRSEWRYWKARALNGLNQQPKARQIFRELAPQREYFSFLAADRLHWPYAMQEAPLLPQAQQLKTLATNPAIKRAKELFYLDMQVEARREWFYVTRGFNEKQLQQAALLAHQWGWHDRAIITVAGTKHRDDLRLRFPLVYQDQVLENAKHYGLDPAWIMGIVRQESAFMEDARSSAGALGLMQLLPSTGKETARLLNIPLRSRYGLLQADKNIRIGSGYLSKMLKRFNGNALMATAAYNAGPHRVDGWRPKHGPQDPELWAELIPYTETRKYVRRVFAYTAVFEWRMERPVTPMSKRMQPIPSRVRLR